MKKLPSETALCFALMALYGVSAVMIGTLIPEMMRAFSLSMARGGLVVTLQSFGGLAAAAAGLSLGDRVRKGRAIVVSFIGLGVSLIISGAAAG